MLNEEEKEEDEQRYVPMNNLDLNFLMTNTVWGDSSQSPKYFRELFDKFEILKDSSGNELKNAEGQTLINKKNLWNMLSFFTRDFRLSNLSSRDLMYCEYYTNLASDYLSIGFIKNFFTSLSYAIARLELCQSKGGFFRKQQNTLTNERISRELSNRKGLFQKKVRED